LPEATDSTEREFANLDLFKATFETNLFGAVTVTEAFLPLLRNSVAGRRPASKSPQCAQASSKPT